MALVDDRGRVFGRFNLIDAVVGVFAIGLIPLLYGAAALFWTPMPSLQAIEPATLTAGPNQFVKIRGQHLRPYMRVSFGTIQGKDFLFKSTQEAVVNLNEMPPGEYDVVLYDVAQEQTRLPKAFTVLPPLRSPTKMTAVGVFGNLDADRAKTLKPGTVVAGVGTILKVGEPMPAKFRINSAGLYVEIPVERAVMLPAEVEAPCEIKVLGGQPFCQVADGVSLHATMMLTGDFGGVKLPFQIDQIRGTEALEPVTARVRFSGSPATIGLLKAGDVDRGFYTNVLSAGATILSVRVEQVNPESARADVQLRINAERSSNGWVYQSLPLRAGGTVMLRTARYEMQGAIDGVTPEWTSPKP
jgi:hypothetical protein